MAKAKIEPELKARLADIKKWAWEIEQAVKDGNGVIFEAQEAIAIAALLRELNNRRKLG